ncbi:SagB family peptide dehydrogenase [Phytohabitans sp. ZYX-F-186]|uniref:SagB family peptide dehydrogenase n=1 Tax=Phytohabitans maris TaxID=3071409 RepID=A0ABU0ZAR9_9ACTN|nr:SagB family peptide dehydrogenase [Phytohabitans sp. ZYX-F-186]MDQ7904159.1 SagB family peptide dehydrogenase [Phytohabitans sp. ZYX-F-186]
MLTSVVADKVRLADDVSVVRTGDKCVVVFRHGRVAFGARDTALGAVLAALEAGPVSRTELEAAALAAGGDPVSVLARLDWLLARLHGALVHSVAVDGREVARVVPLTGDGAYRPAPVPHGPIALSRLAFLRRRGTEAVLESGRSAYRVVLCGSEAVAVAAALARPADLAALAADLKLDARLVARLVAAFTAADLTDAGDSETDQWNFHEILFHARSRLGRHDEPFGATFPYLGERDPLPAEYPAREGPAVVLPRVTLDAVARRDPPLVMVQEARRSVRHYGADPLTLDQLGEFLYRVGRVRAVYGPAEGMPYEAVDRPYPTGGASGDIEIYVTAHRVAGLDRAAYQYDAVAHRLVRVCADPARVDALLRGAAVATGGTPTPDVLLTFTSRFGRMTWKYDGMAYAATLKHVGVLYQTCYLVATAMRLAPCGLGSGDAQLSARVLGLDWASESSVGEFQLGSLPPSAPGAAGAGRPHWRGHNDPEWAARASFGLGQVGRSDGYSGE